MNTSFRYNHELYYIYLQCLFVFICISVCTYIGTLIVPCTDVLTFLFRYSPSLAEIDKFRLKRNLSDYRRTIWCIFAEYIYEFWYVLSWVFLVYGHDKQRKRKQKTKTWKRKFVTESQRNKIFLPVRICGKSLERKKKKE